MTYCLGNVLECVKKTFAPTASSSSVYDSKYKAEKALVDDSNQFCANFQSADWWKIDFKTSVIVTSYKIRTGSGGGWIYNWKVDVSNDDSQWTYIHTKVDTDCQNSPSFEMNYLNSFRYFRITTTGQSSGNAGNNIAFQYIEFNNNISLKALRSKICLTFLIRRNRFSNLIFFTHLIISR